MLHIGIRHYEDWLDDDDDGSFDAICRCVVYSRVSRVYNHIESAQITLLFAMGLNSTQDFRWNNKINRDLLAAGSVKGERQDNWLCARWQTPHNRVIVYSTLHNHLENERVIIYRWHRATNHHQTTTMWFNPNNRAQKAKLKEKSFPHKIF